MSGVRYFPLIVLLTIPAFVIKGMEGDDLAQALQTIGSQQLAKEASDVVWGTEHPVLEQTLEPKIRGIVFRLGDTTSYEKAIDVMQRDALEVLMLKNKDSAFLSDEDKALVIRFVNHLLLVNITQSDKRIAKLKKKANCQLPAVGVICALVGCVVCKFAWGC